MPAIAAGEPAVPLKTWIAVGGALLGAFMAVLNIQITNASLPYIEGGIGTGGVYGTWISTAYLIGEIIVIPLTDFLSRVFSLRRYLLANVALFLVFSVLCGQAQQPRRDDRVARAARLCRRRHDPARLHHHHDDAAALEAGDGACRVRGDGDLRAGDRPDDRRLFHRQLRLALRFLRQPRSRRGDARRAMVRPAEIADAARPAAPGRLARHRADGRRPRRLPDGARRRQRLRLVRLAVHRQTEPRCRGCARRLCRARVLDVQAAGQFPAARSPQFRPRHPGQFSARLRALRLRLSAAPISRRHARLRCGAKRRGHGLDRDCRSCW